MAFIHVANFGLNTEQLEGSKAANPQEDLLLDAHFLVTAIKLGSDFSILPGVFFKACVEEEEWDSANLSLPDTGFYCVIPNFQADGSGRSIAVPFKADWHVIEIVFRIYFLLPPFDVQVLTEISLAVEKPDPEKGNAQVAC
jgi:hypothetical protein